LAGQELPEFALVMRGYDRQQVDDYVSTLRGYLDEMSARANGYDPSRRSESTAIGSPEAASGDPVALLGDRLMRVLHEAQDAATAIRREAEQDAERVREQAVAASRDAGRLLPSTQAQAEQVLSAARDDAEQLLSRPESMPRRKPPPCWKKLRTKATGCAAKPASRRQRPPVTGNGSWSSCEPRSTS